MASNQVQSLENEVPLIKMSASWVWAYKVKMNTLPRRCSWGITCNSSRWWCWCGTKARETTFNQAFNVTVHT